MRKRENISYFEIAKIVSEQNVVAIFQGKSESGPRALGNRSLIYDPRDPNGKNYINKIKGREQFRPLAASVLYEHAPDWFDMSNVRESPYMTFSFKSKESKKNLIPSVVHVDGTCRIQTIIEDQNMHYYRIIKEFFSITNIPMVLNTSFNLAGDPIVETVTDALNTIKKSPIKYLYFPEISLLIEK